jgi:hypothetical protein
VNDLKYYVYVSDAKVDMLFDQFPRDVTERISAELKIDLKLIAVTLRPNTEPATRYAKVRVVSEYLRQHGPLGSVVTPARYVAGTMSLKSTVVGGTAVWCGQRGTTLVGLTGASRHLTGQGHMRGDLGSVPIDALRNVASELARLASEKGPDPAAPDGHVSALAFVAGSIQGLEEQLEFVAVNRGTESLKEPHALLPGVDRMLFGSPLYVAMA